MFPISVQKTRAYQWVVSDIGYFTPFTNSFTILFRVDAVFLHKRISHYVHLIAISQLLVHLRETMIVKHNLAFRPVVKESI